MPGLFLHFFTDSCSGCQNENIEAKTKENQNENLQELRQTRRVSV